MNWRIEGTHDAAVVVERAEQENPDAEPDSALVTYARTAARTLAAKIGEDSDYHVEVQGHETTGDGFNPAHVSVTVSRLNPSR